MGTSQDLMNAVKETFQQYPLQLSLKSVQEVCIEISCHAQNFRRNVNVGLLVT